jgi:hypothetical protein
VQGFVGFGTPGAASSDDVTAAGAFGTQLSEDNSEIQLDSDLRLALKKLSKKDPTTKLKVIKLITVIKRVVIIAIATILEVLSVGVCHKTILCCVLGSAGAWSAMQGEGGQCSMCCTSSVVQTLQQTSYRKSVKVLFVYYYNYV